MLPPSETPTRSLRNKVGAIAAEGGELERFPGSCRVLPRTEAGARSGESVTRGADFYATIGIARPGPRQPPSVRLRGFHTHARPASESRHLVTAAGQAGQGTPVSVTSESPSAAAY